MIRRPRLGALVLAGCLLVSSGCQAAGEWSSDLYVESSSAFTPNPITSVTYFLGLGVGFVAGLPLCVVSLPLALWSHGGEDDERWFGLSAISPALTLGSLTGSALSVPVYPLGYPFVPSEPEPDLSDLAPAETAE